MATWRTLCISCISVALAASAAKAWHGKGHELATRTAFAGLPEDVPAFFREGAETVAHCSVDPDLFTRPIAPEELHDAESPEHYFDLELLEGEKLPPTRYEYLALCFRKGLAPNKVGLLPYSVTEWTQRLAVAFAEYRKWPDDPHIRMKCLVYAGILAHYAEDLCQPLHLTIHWDGRAKADGSSPRTGIHAKVDAALQKLRADPKKVGAELKVAAFEKLMPAVLHEIRRGNSLVGKVYELEKGLPALEEPLAEESEAARFVEERLRACAAFTASLYVTAWEQSAKIELPAWHQRGQGRKTANE